MKRIITVMAGIALLGFGACEQKTIVPVPAEKKTENNTTIVNPPGETKKTESNTTIVNPSTETKTESKTTTTSSSPNP